MYLTADFSEADLKAERKFVYSDSNGFLAIAKLIFSGTLINFLGGQT
jgi:hypothetical protein